MRKRDAPSSSGRCPPGERGKEEGFKESPRQKKSADIRLRDWSYLENSQGQRGTLGPSHKGGQLSPHCKRCVRDPPTPGRAAKAAGFCSKPGTGKGSPKGSLGLPRARVTFGDDLDVLPAAFFFSLSSENPSCWPLLCGRFCFQGISFPQGKAPVPEFPAAWGQGSTQHPAPSSRANWDPQPPSPHPIQVQRNLCQSRMQPWELCRARRGGGMEIPLLPARMLQVLGATLEQ